MKKIITLALAGLLFAGSSFAATTTVGPNIPTSVTKEFGQHFKKAATVQWETVKDFYKATFTINGITLFAFYTGEGNLIGVAHNLSPAVLPQPLHDKIKTAYAGYWITDLFSYHNADDHGFVITLENADRTVTLKSEDNDWTFYKTSAKN